MKANLEAVGLVDSLSYWTFTDVFEEGGAGDTVFHGGFGMINLQGIVKPTFHAYRFLHALGDELLAPRPGRRRDPPPATGKLTALAYHYPPEMPLSVPASFDDARQAPRRRWRRAARQTLASHLTGLRPGAPFAVETLEPRHGNALAAWQAMGSPSLRRGSRRRASPGGRGPRGWRPVPRRRTRGAAPGAAVRPVERRPGACSYERQRRGMIQ